jgi:hypothetical protein
MQFLGMCDPQTVTDQTMHSVLAQSVSCLLWRQPENKGRREHPDSATASCI